MLAETSKFEKAPTHEARNDDDDDDDVDELCFMCVCVSMGDVNGSFWLPGPGRAVRISWNWRSRRVPDYEFLGENGKCLHLYNAVR